MKADGERAYSFISRPGAKPFAIERAEGAYLITPRGKRILDAAGGAIVSNIGHGRAEVGAAYARAVTEVSYVVPPFATPDRVRLVERLRNHWLPEELSRVAFTSGGSEAMDAAIRLVRQHFVSSGQPERWKVIGRGLSYHGATLATLAIGGHEKRRAPFAPWMPELPKAPACFCTHCPLGKTFPGCALACADELDRIIDEAGPDTVAAFVAEPISGSTIGAVAPPDGYWSRISEICRDRGILLVFDEVMSGFGRTGKRFALEHWGVVPDILVSGKGLSSGYAPICGIFAREEVIAPIAAARDELMFFTYAAHGGVCAAADAVLDIMERERLVERAAVMGQKLRERLKKLDDHPNVAEIRGRGLLLGVELVEDRDTRTPFPKQAALTAKVVAAGLELGAFFYPGGSGPAPDVIVLGPPFTIGETEIELISDILERAISSAVERVQNRGGR
jgi:adenosylmethionine-8-amino-7-oxononanoate aminotransferase